MSRTTRWLLMALLMFSGPAAMAQGYDKDTELAKRSYLLGEELFRRSNYTKAITQFKLSYDLSRRPALLFNIARCHELLGEHREALKNYRAYLESKPSNAPLVRTRIANLERQLSRKAPVASQPAQKVAPPPPPPPRRRPLRTAGWVSLGIGVASVITGVALGLLASGKADDLEAAASAHQEWQDVKGDHGSGQGLETGAIVGFAVGGAALATGVLGAQLVDLYGNGKPDLMVRANQHLKSLTLHRNASTTTSAASFAPVTLNKLKEGVVNHLSLRDLDRDGVLDLVAAQHDKTKKTFISLCSGGGQGSLTCAEVRPQTSGARYTAFVVGDFDGAPAHGVQIVKAAHGAVVKNFGVIRGFAIGVDSHTSTVSVSSLTVEDADHFGVRLTGATSGTVQQVKVRHHFQGAALAFVDCGAKSAVEVKDNTLCPARGDPRHAPVSTYCARSTVPGFGSYPCPIHALETAERRNRERRNSPILCSLLRRSWSLHPAALGLDELHCAGA